MPHDPLGRRLVRAAPSFDRRTPRKRRARRQRTRRRIPSLDAPPPPEISTGCVAVAERYGLRQARPSGMKTVERRFRRLSSTVRMPTSSRPRSGESRWGIVISWGQSDGERESLREGFPVDAFRHTSMRSKGVSSA